MSVTASYIMLILEQIAPRELSESYDNVGLLAGHPAQTVERVLVALDLTEGVVREAEKAGAQMIVTHHPIFFRGRKNIREDDAEGAAVCSLIRAHLALAAAHTNFDNAFWNNNYFSFANILSQNTVLDNKIICITHFISLL